MKIHENSKVFIPKRNHVKAEQDFIFPTDLTEKQTRIKSLEMTKLAIIFQAGTTPYLIMTETQVVPGTRQMTLLTRILVMSVNFCINTLNYQVDKHLQIHRLIY